MVFVSKVEACKNDILKMWEEGLSGQQIADKIGTTRSAVMGKLHRMREQKIITYKSVASRMAAVKHSVRTKERSRLKEEGVDHIEIEKELPPLTYEEILKPLIIEAEKKPTSIPVKFEDLGPFSCRYVVEGIFAKDFLFCNEVKKTGSSYCVEHHSKCKTILPIHRKKEQSNDATAKPSNPSLHPSRQGTSSGADRLRARA